MASSDNSKKSVHFANDVKTKTDAPIQNTMVRYRPSGYVDYSSGKPVYVQSSKKVVEDVLAKIKTMTEPYHVNETSVRIL